MTEDFPTLERPENVICGTGSVGNCLASPAEMRKVALLRLSFNSSTSFCQMSARLCGWLGEPWGVFVWGAVYFFGLWYVLYWLYKKQIFFKV